MLQQSYFGGLIRLFLIGISYNLDPVHSKSAIKREDFVQGTAQNEGVYNRPSVVRSLESRSLWDIVTGTVQAAASAVQKFAIGQQLKATRTLNNTDVCYEGVGCFNYTENMRLDIGGPQSPEEVGTTFYFFTESSGEDLDELLNENKTTVMPDKTWTLSNWTLQKMREGLDTSKNMTVVTHGLTGSKRTPWMLPLVKAILSNLHGTVLVVDWEKGANGSYTDAGVNTPMPGVEIALFLYKIVAATLCKIGPDNITLVGFSMGAQVMGFAGRHFNKTASMPLARITGLDPAGYLFENTNVTLSKNDAKFVDVIHTQGGDIYDFKLGLRHSVGHVDFYPNGGSVQQGCPMKPTVGSKTFWDDFTCSHYRAPALYIESLNRSDCTFYSFHCASWEEFENRTCFDHFDPSQMGIMGYYSFEAGGRGDQYLYTNAQPPYCRGNNTTPPDVRKE